MKERLTLLDAVRSAVPSDVPVIIGTGELAARVSSAELTQALASTTVPMPLSRCPLTTADVREYYEDIASAAGTFPVDRVSLPEGLDERRHRHRGAPPAPHRRAEGLDRRSDRLLEQLAQWTTAPSTAAPRSMALYAGMLGCTGAILAAANLEPELAATAFGGNVAAQRASRSTRTASRRTTRPTASSSELARRSRHVTALPPPSRLNSGDSSLVEAENTKKRATDPSTASRPTVTPGRSATAFTARSTPGMNEVRS